MKSFRQVLEWVDKNGIVYCIGYVIRKLLTNKVERGRLKNTGFSIFSQNCVGCVITHDLGQPFNSPTVNLYMNSEDYIFFLEHPKDFVGEKLVFVPSEKRYPKAQISVKTDDISGVISLYFPHEMDENKIQEEWLRRSKRVNYDNLFVIATDRDGLTEELLERFHKLPYKNKILLSSKQYDKYPFIQYYKRYQRETQLPTMVRIINIFGKREYGQGWDYVKWLNNGCRES
jgi:uncharacterized protein (DUF1919 family)